MLHITKADEVETYDWMNKQAQAAAVKLSAMGFDPKTLLSTEAGWLMCLAKYQDQLLQFDAYQLRFMTSKQKKRILNKARQIGFSFTIACESLARSHIRKKHTAVCVSYNLDDAKEKVSLVKELHEALPLRFKKKLSIDSKTEVGFSSNTNKRSMSRIISYPSKAPRGKHGDVYLDEFAHCQNDAKIYTGSTALISRSKGQLTIGSTPLGRRGRFFELFDDPVENPGWWRQEIPWWLCSQFCSDISKAVHSGVSNMSTAERVWAFGTAAIKEQFELLNLEDFQQEYELSFQDERVSYFPYDIILPCAKREDYEIPVYRTLDELVQCRTRIGPLVAGFDVGRTRHPSELYIFERARSGKFITRYNEQFKNMPFPMQRERLKTILNAIEDQLEVFRIDSTGLGRNLAEDLQFSKRIGRKVQAVQFTLGMKSRLAANMKILLQEGMIVLPKDRSLTQQIHSIKQKITASGNSVFDSDEKRNHHADKFWAIALACYRPERVRKKVPMDVGVRILGDGEGKTDTEKTDDSAPLGHRLFPDNKIPVTKESSLPQNARKLTVIRPDINGAIQQLEKMKSALLVYEQAGYKDDANEMKERIRSMKKYIGSLR